MKCQVLGMPKLYGSSRWVFSYTSGSPLPPRRRRGQDIADTPDFSSLFTQNIYRKILEVGGYGRQAAALAAGGGASGVSHEERSNLLEAKGSGIPQDAFERFLVTAAKRLDKVRTERAKRKAEKAVEDFDPDQPREPAGTSTGGQWASSGGGGGAAFVSPNVEQTTFEGAQKGLASYRQYALQEAADEIDAELGLESTHANIIGAWADGAENSVLSEIKNPDWDTLKTSGAMKGFLADQKAVLLFKQDDEGKAVLYTMEYFPARSRARTSSS